MGDLKWTSNNLLSLIGIFNTVGEVLVGYLGDKEWIDLNCFYAGKISFLFNTVCLYEISSHTT